MLSLFALFPPFDIPPPTFKLTTRPLLAPISPPHSLNHPLSPSLPPLSQVYWMKYPLRGSKEMRFTPYAVSMVSEDGPSVRP